VRRKLLNRALPQTLRGEKRKIKAMAAKPTTNRLISLGSGVIARIGWGPISTGSGDEKDTGLILTVTIAGYSTGKLLLSNDPKSKFAGLVPLTTGNGAESPAPGEGS
jgi:hypothetical protein